MQAVEINAGAWYLRALRADDRISDVPALTELGIDDPVVYVATTDDDPERCVWAVCIPTTGELVALIGVAGTPKRSTLTGVARAGFDEALAAAQGPVTRFAHQALDLTPGAVEIGLP